MQHNYTTYMYALHIAPSLKLFLVRTQFSIPAATSITIFAFYRIHWRSSQNFNRIISLATSESAAGVIMQPHCCSLCGTIFNFVPKANINYSGYSYSKRQNRQLSTLTPNT